MCYFVLAVVVVVVVAYQHYHDQVSGRDGLGVG